MKAMEQRVAAYAAKLENYPKLCELYKNCYPNTAKTAIEALDDDTVFVVTGDIPAMWLRDSSAQVTHYIPLANDPEVGKLLRGVLRRQFAYIKIDPYANAFNKAPNGAGHVDDLPKMNPWVFERKYEIDSLCYPIRLLYLYWKQTGDNAFVAHTLEEVCDCILTVWETEQHHAERSDYFFVREPVAVPWDTLSCGGNGAPVGYTGMTWSGFRPSDDACEYGYLVAANMFAVVVLGYMAEMLAAIGSDAARIARCRTLREQIDGGIRQYAVVEHEKYGRIYACEVDGLGRYALYDDANIPSLLSIPYLGYTTADDPIYQNTRRFLLSEDNPYYFRGRAACGIGSRHTPDGYIWHLALIMQGLTSVDTAEKRMLLDMIAATDAGTGFMHEGFMADDPTVYTRGWFTWPDSLLAEWIERCVEEGIL